MRRAIDETERRRGKQLAYNAAHGITPRGVSKRVKDIIEGVYDHEEARTQLKREQTEARYAAMDEKALTREVKQLEKAMLDAARNLEFERAAQLRDQLKALKEKLFLGLAA
jgi:excinuclease ABC subunit B